MVRMNEESHRQLELDLSVKSQTSQQEWIIRLNKLTSDNEKSISEMRSSLNQESDSLRKELNQVRSTLDSTERSNQKLQKSIQLVQSQLEDEIKKHSENVLKANKLAQYETTKAKREVEESLQIQAQLRLQEAINKLKHDFNTQNQLASAQSQDIESGLNQQIFQLTNKLEQAN